MNEENIRIEDFNQCHPSLIVKFVAKIYIMSFIVKIVELQSAKTVLYLIGQNHSGKEVVLSNKSCVLNVIVDLD